VGRTPTPGPALESSPQLAYVLTRITEKEMEKKRRQVAELEPLPARPAIDERRRQTSLREEKAKRNALRSYLLSKTLPSPSEEPQGDGEVVLQPRAGRGKGGPVVAPSAAVCDRV